ncbi:hypothetical protein Gogos_020303 [Gossypium gossypioides]|uniref:CCHC-type domain-containing protein n=1 Tax=Gossypium gossypioides TaxID=34282 RepID=A0A7J9D302_GOSGO|nr:hypothetical protein [Gossypium gossypioides]
MIGTFQKIDLQTDKGLRGQFARFVVQVDLLKPLILKIRIAKRTHRVEYESLPMICNHCGTYGHLQEDCPETKMRKLWLKKFLVIKRNQVRAGEVEIGADNNGIFNFGNNSEMVADTLVDSSRTIKGKAHIKMGK